MNMLAEQSQASSKLTASLEDMRAASARDFDTPEAVAENLRPYIRSLAMLGMQTKDNISIHDACVHLYHHFADIRQSPRVLTPGERNLLSIWPEALAACLDAPNEDHSAPLNLVMAECGVLIDDILDMVPVTDPVPATAEVIDFARAGNVLRTEKAEANVTEPLEPDQSLPEVREADCSDETDPMQIGALFGMDETAVAADPLTSVLQTLEAISALVSEGPFSNPQTLNQDDLLRYAMALVEMRESAEQAGLRELQEACDELSPVLARLMEAQEPASAEDGELLSGFPLRALDLMVPSDTSEGEEIQPDMTTFEGLTEEFGQPGEIEITALTELAANPIMVGDKPTGEQGARPAASQQVSPDLLGMLVAELGGIAEALQPLLLATQLETEPEARAQACEESGEIFERLGHASESIGLTALSGVLDRLGRNIRAAVSTPVDLNRLTTDFLARLGNYLTYPADVSASAGLVDVLLDPAWAEPLSAEAGAELIAKLASVELVEATDQTEARPEHAQSEDVSLQLPEDLNPALLENLLLELPQQVGMFTEAIGRIADGNGNLQDVETAKRAAHTLKGAANTVGVRGIASLTHHLEDILIAFSDRGVLPGAGIAGLLIRAGDCLETMNEALQGTGPAPDDAQEILQEVLDYANRIDREGLPEEEAVQATAVAQARVAEPAKVQETPEQVSMLRVPTTLIDELLRLVGETITTNAQIQERLRQSIKQAQAVRAQNRLLHQLVSELDGLVDIHGSAFSLRSGSDRGEFDALEMEQYSELHTLKNRLIEAVTDVHEISAQNEAQLQALGEVVEVQSRLQLESQEAVMRTRMVRVETIVSRLQRGVRQASRLLDKSVSLEVKGGETLMDGGVLSELVDPIMHVLRNAVDHGIEDPEARLAKGKNAEGHIELSFVREGNSIAVRCRDDGGGLNLETIRNSAIERGLIDGSQQLSDDEVARLILIPGFSTRNEATQISGRGIGMDIVNARVQALKGSLSLHSKPGQGLNLEIRIPLSMLSTHALLVRIRDRMIALSTRNIEDIHYVTPGQIRRLGDKWHYQVNDVVYDVLRLESLLNLPGDRRVDERTGFPLMLVRQSDGVLRAIEVQEIIDSRNLVMKNLGNYVPAIKGVAGAAILGDGSVVPVIDLPDLLNAGARLPAQASREEIDGYNQTVRADLAGRRVALVVDDSLSARRSTAQVLKDAGFEVRTAIDGLEAVTMLRRFKPDIILADMEMPRMNGLELTSHVRGEPSTHDIPVIMITSRSTDKHRKQAQGAGVSVYLTKPFNDELLLQHVTALTEAAVT